MSRILIETCCASLDDAYASAACQIKRIELNSALPLGGLSPSSALLSEIKRNTNLKVMVMLRPRAGGMCYSDNEFREMELALKDFLDRGADGIVFGVLTEDGLIDLKRTEKLRRLVDDKEVVFHRAFDLLPDQMVGLSQLIDLGFTRILTSGGRGSAPLGKKRLMALNEASHGKITILPGAGLRPHNLLAFLEGTNFKEIHYTPRMPRFDLSSSHNKDIHFGLPGLDETELTGFIDQNILKNSIQQLSSL